jgi:hypothetical protein
MFDSNVYKSETKVVAVTKEIEKTISPDKVTEMYDAVREQAERRPIRRMAISRSSTTPAASTTSR